MHTTSDCFIASVPHKLNQHGVVLVVLAIDHGYLGTDVSSATKVTGPHWVDHSVVVE